MSKVFGLDTNKKPLNPVHPGQARRLLNQRKASFNISTKDGLIQGISHKYCQHIHQKDGYAYVA